VEVARVLETFVGLLVTDVDPNQNIGDVPALVPMPAHFIVVLE